MKLLLKKIIGLRTILLIKGWFKSSNKNELLDKRRKFYKQFLTKEGDLFFDVGANDGNRIEPIINEGFNIVAIEPQKSCVEFLKAKFGNKITLVPNGLGAKEETRTMYIADTNVLSTFSEDFIRTTQASGRFKSHNWEKKQKVEVTTLDNLIAKYGKPKFIKIDVEGFEFEVLKGLSQPIENLSFEYTIPERKQSILDCIDRVTTISGENNVTFNYSIGESMQWAIDDWRSSNQMKKEIETDRFLESNSGDVYAKLLKE